MRTLSLARTLLPTGHNKYDVMKRRVSAAGFWIRPLCAAIAAVLFAGACGETFQAPRPPRDRINYPVGLHLHPNGRFLYVVNSNFNAKYRADSGGTVSVIDTQTLEILGDSTPFLPSFGGAIELNDDASRAYVTAREGNQLVAFRVAGGDADTPAGGALFCLDDDGEPTSNPEKCSFRKVPRGESGSRLSNDPFSLDVATIRRTNPESGEEVPIDLVSLSYLGSNRVSTISIPNRSLGSATIETASLIAGSNRIERRPGTLSYYVAGRNTNVVARFAPFLNLRTTGTFGEVEALFQQGEISLSNFVTSEGSGIAVDARGLAFDESGRRLYVATRQPDALHVFELGASNRETGEGLKHRLSASISLDDNPSDIVVHESPDGRRLLYVTSFGDNSINVVDPESKTVIDQIELDASPYEMAVDTGSTRCSAPGETCRGYVTLFKDTKKVSATCGPEANTCGSVAVIDLDPASARFNQVIRKIR